MPRGFFSESRDLLAEDNARSQRAAAEVRAHPSSTEHNWAGYFGDPQSATGVSVTPETSLRTAAVFACVQVISGTIATLPLRIYRRRADGGKERATKHPLFPLLHDAPNDLLTSCEFREMMQAHLCLRGNAYAKVTRTGGGVVAKIDPIHPDRVSVFKRGDVMTYSVQRQEGGGQDILGLDEMLHVRAMGPEGIIGYSPITLARESIGLAIATERHGARLFSNGAKPSGVLETPNQLSKDQLKMMREEWDRTHAGVDNANKTAILFGGLKYSGVSMSNEDAQFLETRKFQVTDIARIFRVPPHKIADLSQATFSNIEHQSIEFVTDCIGPWAKRWEQRMNLTLLTPGERREYFIELALDGILRGDTVSRYNAHKIGREAGFLSPNDIRDMENMNRIDGGDSYMQPLNFTKLGQFAGPDGEDGYDDDLPEET